MGNVLCISAGQLFEAILASQEETPQKSAQPSPAQLYRWARNNINNVSLNITKISNCSYLIGISEHSWVAKAQ